MESLCYWCNPDSLGGNKTLCSSLGLCPLQTNLMQWCQVWASKAPYGRHLSANELAWFCRTTWPLMCSHHYAASRSHKGNVLVTQVPLFPFCQSRSTLRQNNWRLGIPVHQSFWRNVDSDRLKGNQCYLINLDVLLLFVWFLCKCQLSLHMLMPWLHLFTVFVCFCLQFWKHAEARGGQNAWEPPGAHWGEAEVQICHNMPEAAQELATHTDCPGWVLFNIWQWWTVSQHL